MLLVLVVTGMNLRLRTCILTHTLISMHFSMFWWQVVTGQVASTGMVALSYVQKVSEKVKKVQLENLCSYILFTLNTDFFYLGFSSIRLNVQLHVKR